MSLTSLMNIYTPQPVIVKPNTPSITSSIICLISSTFIINNNLSLSPLLLDNSADHSFRFSDLSLRFKLQNFKNYILYQYQNRFSVRNIRLFSFKEEKETRKFSIPPLYFRGCIIFIYAILQICNFLIQFRNSFFSIFKRY